MFCSNCGSSLKEGAKFCAFCGQKIVIPEPMPAPEPIPAAVPTEPRPVRLHTAARPEGEPSLFRPASFDEPMPEAPAAPETPAFEEPEQPAFEAETPEAPETPVFEEPETPVFEEPEQPVAEAPEVPETPAFEAPETPVFEEPEQPAFEAPEEPAFEAPAEPETRPAWDPLFAAGVPAFEAPEEPVFGMPEETTPAKPEMPVFVEPEEPAYRETAPAPEKRKRQSRGPVAEPVDQPAFLPEKEPEIPAENRPLSPWAYFGYGLLFLIPGVNLILLIVFSFAAKNVNLRNFARSYWCGLALVLTIVLVLLVLVLTGVLKGPIETAIKWLKETGLDWVLQKLAQ